MRNVGILGLAVAIGFAALTVRASPASAAEELSADTPLTTARGATFTAPKGWGVISAANKIVLDPPEAPCTSCLEVEATDDAAVAAGWASYRPRPSGLADPDSSGAL
jgi:hypothetical protein